MTGGGIYYRYGYGTPLPEGSMVNSMKMNTIKVGGWLLLSGILLLAGGILCAFAVGTVAVPILIGLSILVNSVAVMLIADGKNRGNRKADREKTENNDKKVKP